MKAFFISVPHSGEQIPPEVTWLNGLAEPIVMCDVDRYVDRLYQPAFDEVQCPHIVTQWHRYVVDLNRLPDDIDTDSVRDAANPAGTFTRGLHWVKTTKNDVLMPVPISQELHHSLVDKYFEPFHKEVRTVYQSFKDQGAKDVYHLDAHSMPSMGTSAHKDPGQKRAEIVVSDCHGQSAKAEYKDLVIEAYTKAGFQVGYNWPYVGGRVTETYGHPEQGQHAIQVELNRSLYMDENTKRIINNKAAEVSEKIRQAVAHVFKHLPS